ncbi:MAG: 1-deoxy-D-xylulose-5-phosphate reductoisomerase [Bacteroidales bacterium]|nr:1-deoxy-D-xylulose-5-phosphate reductoisomerase [Bacteroidales bacterium]MDD3666399.1 1-deoxy-D-xylulose-5-phosphate reductoisomerase [Bacteroidales bacterium]
MKRLAILGSTGSIGQQALDVIRTFPDQFQAEVLTADTNVELLAAQAVEFLPNAVVIANEKYYPQLCSMLAKVPVKVFTGTSALVDVVAFDTVDMVLTAMVGFAGLKPTLSAIRNGKHVALANKETLVVAGDLVTRLAFQHQVNILPVDSEHSAIFQCLAGERLNKPRKLIITGSGGPFKGFTARQLESVTPEAALQHPTWKMGKKITIDSATLMNKGLEMIEAHWLFSMPPQQIMVLIHPQSVIHSMVEFADGSVKAQLGLPDMRLPIQYALSYPFRLESVAPRVDFSRLGQFSFQPPDTSVFRCLALAYEAIDRGGNMPCVLNAANEIAVQAFLNQQIGFTSIASIVEKCMSHISLLSNPGEDDYLLSDAETRKFAASLV